MQDEIGHYTEMTSHILQTHIDYKMIALGDLLPTELKAILKKVENVSFTPNQSSYIHVSLSTDYLIQELSIFGHVMDSAPSPSQSTWSSESVVKVKAELRSKSHDGAVVPGEVEDHGDGTYTITLTPQTAGPHQPLITMDGQHVQNSPCDLDVRRHRQYNTLCDPEQVIHRRQGPGSGIGIHDNGDIYGQCESCQGEFYNPSSVIVDQRDRLIVSDTSNDRVVILDQAGPWLLTINGKATGSHHFQRPQDLALDAQGNIHIAN
ncbi:hypothetical protein EMCRGX_G000485 [Ephydatia muelleri]